MVFILSTVPLRPNVKIAMMMTRLRLLFVSVLPFTATAGFAAGFAGAGPEPAAAAAKDRRVTKLQKLGEQDVVIPVPSEIFNALDKMGGDSLNWKAQVAPRTPRLRPTNPAEIAMMLGNGDRQRLHRRRGEGREPGPGNRTTVSSNYPMRLA